MRTCSHGEPDNSAEDFIINNPKGIIRSKPKQTSRAVRGSANTNKKLQQAVTAPGQQKVSDYYFIDPADINNVNYLPDLVTSHAAANVCIVIASDESLEGPEHVSSPSSETQIFEYPNVSPIVSDDECIVLADSD